MRTDGRFKSCCGDISCVAFPPEVRWRELDLVEFWHSQFLRLFPNALFSTCKYGLVLCQNCDFEQFLEPVNLNGCGQRIRRGQGSGLSEEMIVEVSKDDLAEAARILAMQAEHYARKYGEVQPPDLAHLLSATAVDGDSIALLREGRGVQLPTDAGYATSKCRRLVIGH